MKKGIYVLLTIFLCLMLLFILNAFVAMPTWLQYVFLIAGTVGGYFLGQYDRKVPLHICFCGGCPAFCCG